MKVLKRIGKDTRKELKRMKEEGTIRMILDNTERTNVFARPIKVNCNPKYVVKLFSDEATKLVAKEADNYEPDIDKLREYCLDGLTIKFGDDESQFFQYDLYRIENGRFLQINEFDHSCGTGYQPMLCMVLDLSKFPIDHYVLANRGKFGHLNSTNMHQDADRVLGTVINIVVNLIATNVPTELLTDFEIEPAKVRYQKIAPYTRKNGAKVKGYIKKIYL